MNRVSRAARAAILFTGFGYAAQALSLAAIPLYLSSIGANGYGLMVLTMSFMGYLNFADAGLSWGSMILIGQAHGLQDRALIGKIVRNSAVLATGSGAVVLVAVAIVIWLATNSHRLPMFAEHPEADVLILIGGIQLVVTLQAGVFFNLFQGLQEAYWTAFYQGLGRLVSTCSMMGVAWVTHSVQSVMLAQLLVNGLFAIACALHAWKRHPWIFSGGTWIDSEQLKLQVRTGFKVFLLQIGRTLIATAPVMAISSTLGPASVPLYTIPTTLLQIAFMPLNAWSTSLHSAYGEAWASGNRSWVVDVFRRTLERGLFWGACGAALFLPLAIPFISLWTGGRIVLPSLMPLAVVGIAFTGWFTMTGQYLLSGLNLQRKVAIAEIICGVIVIGVSPVMVQWFGPPGVAVGLLVPALAISIRRMVTEVKVHVSPNAFPAWATFFRVLLILIIAGGAGCLLVATTDGGGVMRRSVIIATGAAYTLVLFCSFSVLARLDFLSEAVGQLLGGLKRRGV